jgi:multiple sugar transport system substrate-binding protein
MYRSPLARKLTTSLTAAAVLLAIAIPGATRASSTRSHSHAGATISVVYSASYLFDADPQATAFWGSIKQQFEKRYPGNHLTLIPEPGLDVDELNKINLMLRLPQTTPDVLSIPTYPIGSMSQSGFLAPLNSYVSKWSAWKQFPASVRAENTIGHNVWGVNTGNNDFGLLYSMPLFRKAGIKVPWHPRTWNAVLSALAKVKAHNHGVYGMQIRVGSANGYATTLKGIANWVVGSRQPTIYDYKTHKWVVRSPGLLDTFKFFHTAVARGLLGPANDQTMLKPTGNIVWDWMPHQKYAVVVGGNWYPGLWLPGQGGTPWPGAKKVYSVAPIPTENGQKPGSATAIGGWAYAITKNSPHKALAWKLIQLLEQSGNSIKLANQSGVIPPAKSDFSAKSFINFAPPYNAAYNRFIKNGVSLPNMPGILKWEQAINDVSGNLITNSHLTAQQAQNQFATEATQLIGSRYVETKK